LRAIFAIALAAVGTARAQGVPGGFDAHGFVMGPLEADLRDPIGWVRPGVFHAGDAYAGLALEYARRPLVAITSAAASGPVLERALIRDLGVANAVAGVAAHQRARLDLAFPVYLVSAAPGQVLGPAPGDLRATVTAVALRPDDTVGGGGIGLGISGWVDAPTGSPERYLGRSGLAGGARVAFTAESRVATLNAAVGAQLDPSIDVANLSGADQLTGALGVAIAASDRVGLGLEATGAAALAKSAVAGSASPAEATLSVRYADPGGLAFVVGAGRALTRGVGAPDVRAFVGVSVGRLKPLREPDSDPIGALNVADRCPVEPETRNGWRDEDGCPDQLGLVRPEVVFEGQLRPGAELVVEGLPEPFRGPFRAGMPAWEVLPETPLSARATSDGCLSGEARHAVTEGENTLRVELVRVLDARVTVQVEDMLARPIPNAIVTWLSDKPLCVPGEAIPVDTAGAATTGIGAGEHQLVVDAEGYQMVYESFTFEPGQERSFAVVLEPIVVEEPEPELSLVVVEREQIRILEKVLFETGKAVIRPASFALLDQVAQTILDHPDVGRVEVAGHTDDRGSDGFNLDLSQRRADAVRAYLIRYGVAEERLLAVGYGEARPLQPNETEVGREANRRVEFNLIDAPADEAPPAEEATP
jgi:outer membrane protein OmpA-like peptidoglycan-associated protein